MLQFIIETSRILFNNNDILKYLLFILTMITGTGVLQCKRFLKVG